MQQRPELHLERHLITGRRQELEYQIELIGDAPEGAVTALCDLAGSRSTDPTRRHVRYRVEGHPVAGAIHWELFADGSSVLSSSFIGETITALLHDLNLRATRRELERLSVHAAAVAADGVGMLLPAPSGSGKSTMCAALLGEGLDYITDESAAIDQCGVISGLARPLGLKSGVREALPQLDLECLDFGVGHVAWHVPASHLGAPTIAGAHAGLVVVPRYDRDAESVELTTKPRAAVAMAILCNSQNLDLLGTGRALDIASTIAASACCYDLRYSDATAAAGAIAAQIPHAARSPSGSWSLLDPVREDVGARAGTRTSPDVQAVAFDDGALLWDLSRGAMLVVNPIGAFLWQLLAGGQAAGVVVSRAAERFETSPAEIEPSIHRWLGELRQRRFLID